jgi:PKD repeat protein
VAERLRCIGRDQAGLSLIELLVVMAITVVVGTAILTTVAGSARAERTALDMRENTDRARIAVERVRDTVRAAYGVCGSSNDTALVLWAGDTVDADGNRRIEPAELIRFEIVDGELRRQDGAGTPGVVAFGLGDDSRFGYVDRASAPVADPAAAGLDCTDQYAVVEGRGEIATVNVLLAGNTSPGERTPATVVETSVTLRNAAMLDGTINPNRPPVALFSALCSDRTCSFNAHASYDEDGNVVRYRWHIEGVTAVDSPIVTTLPVLEYTLPTYGSHQVVLTVEDDEGGTSSTSRWVNLIADSEPAAGFTVECPSMTCSFDASPSLVGGASPDAFEWDFGEAGATTTGTTPTVSHAYAAPGSYSVTLTVRIGDRSSEAREWANPTDQPSTVRIADIEDISTSMGGSGNWVPKVKIRAVYPDGAAAHQVTVFGRFGPSPDVANDLKSNTTNSLGEVSLQANGQTSNETFYFEVTGVAGKTIDPTGSTLSVVLRRPGT